MLGDHEGDERDQPRAASRWRARRGAPRPSATPRSATRGSAATAAPSWPATNSQPGPDCKAVAVSGNSEHLRHRLRGRDGHADAIRLLRLPGLGRRSVFHGASLPHERCALVAGGGRSDRLRHAEQIQYGIFGHGHRGGRNRRRAARASAKQVALARRRARNSDFFPNLLWQWRHDFISLQFLQHIHARDVRIGRTKDFLPDQLTLTLFALPVALSGLLFYFSSYGGRRFRVLGWMFVVPFVLFVLGKGRAYYMAAGYPILYAGGAVLLAAWLSHLARTWRMLTGAIGWTAMAANIILFGALFLPIAPVNSPWWHRMAATNDDVKEEIGWQELAETVARSRCASAGRSRASAHPGRQLRRSGRD